MSIVKRWILERVTTLDMHLMGRFPRREAARVQAHLHAQRHIFGPVGSTLGANGEALRIPVCLGGLEVRQTSAGAGTLSVLVGTMLAAHPSPVTESRPGTWSGVIESDDGANSIFVLPATATVTPSPTLATPPVGNEWWTVYVTPTVVARETDSQRRVFNETTGTFDVSPATKVEQLTLVPGVVRGNGGGSIPDPPAGGIPVAWLYVPSGATTLNDAVVYDVRRLLHDDPGPNQVGGQWRCPITGQLASPYTDGIFEGEVKARLSGEVLGARARTPLLQVGDLAEPGATWDAAASPSAPKMAWLYLTKVKGLVPRPVRQGQSPLGHGSTLQTNVLIEGALVLSPTPPKIGGSTTLNETFKSGLRWDLRPSAALALPSHNRGVAYAYGGLTAQPDEALCVGFYRYTGLTGGGLPLVEGVQVVGRDGWVCGRAISNQPAGLLPPPALLINNATTPRTLKSDSYGVATITVDGFARALPITSVRLFLDIGISGALGPVLGTGEEWQRLWYFDNTDHVTLEIERHQFTFGAATLPGFEFWLTSDDFALASAVYLRAVRFPYGEDLVT